MISYGSPTVRGIARAGLFYVSWFGPMEEGANPGTIGKAKQGPLSILQAIPSTFSSSVC